MADLTDGAAENSAAHLGFFRSSHPGSPPVFHTSHARASARVMRTASNPQAAVYQPRRRRYGHFELSAHMTVRPGFEGFKKQAAECIRITQEKDTQTLRYDWFLSRDGTECEVREAYTGPEGLIEHNRNILEARTKLFKDYADSHFMTVYGEVSEPLLESAEGTRRRIQVVFLPSGTGAIRRDPVADLVAAGAAKQPGERLAMTQTTEAGRRCLRRRLRRRSTRSSRAREPGD